MIPRPAGWGDDCWAAIETCHRSQTRATTTGMHYAVVKQRLDEELVLDNEVGVALLRRRKAQVHENCLLRKSAAWDLTLPPRPAIFRPLALRGARVFVPRSAESRARPRGNKSPSPALHPLLVPPPGRSVGRGKSPRLIVSAVLPSRDGTSKLARERERERERERAQAARAKKRERKRNRPRCTFDRSRSRVRPLRER